MHSSVLPLLLSVGPALLVLLLVPSNLSQDHPYGRAQGDASSCSWTCLLLTLQWPAAFCQSLDKGRLCHIPQGVNQWTIHGLWPQGGLRCCSCWPMFPSDVQELQAELNVRWPSLLTHNSSFLFWYHEDSSAWETRTRTDKSTKRSEWQKHGTCAACVEGFNSPLRYFQLCLKLRRQFEIDGLLERAGITPSCNRSYKVSEVHQVLVPHVGDIREIQCVQDRQGREVWFQVKISLSRSLTVGCSSEPDWRPSGGHPCPANVPFFYLPINHQHPDQPCG